MSSARAVYLDHNATTPCAPEVVAAMAPFLSEAFGNAGSPHSMGRAAAAAIAGAREAVASLAGCRPGQIIFTSGATESNNMALLGLARSRPERHKIVVCSVEHKSVLAPAEYLADQGFEIVKLPVDHNALINLAAAAELVDEETLLVSVQGANNEVGTVQPVAQLGELARARGAMMHTDSAQVLGKIPLDLSGMPVDLASFSAHKLYGPKGVGALYVRSAEIRSRLMPLQFGGGQEDGLRPGTHNVAAIVGFGAACVLTEGSLSADIPRITRLRDMLETLICTSMPSTFINARSVWRLPGTSSMSFPGVPSDLVVATVQKVQVSDGSACSSGSPAPSHVLRAMMLEETRIDSAIRVSLGRGTTRTEVSLAAAELTAAVSRALGLAVSSQALP
ncbi:MAG: cysteine desulfurase family protein [Armatimonadota bacterium]